MINKRQYLILKKHITPQRAENTSSFHALTGNGYLDTDWSTGRDLYVTNDKGMAEIENYERNAKSAKLSVIAIIVSVVGILINVAITIVFKFFV